MTGGRLKQAQDYIGDETFMMTYGDGLANINMFHLLKRHQDLEQLRLSQALKRSPSTGH